MAIIQDRSADAIIEALGGNSSGMCRCPAHDDNNPSLHVSEGANGKVLVKCHAGCSQEAVINTAQETSIYGQQTMTADSSSDSCVSNGKRPNSRIVTA